jgi:hypothetical protein
MPSWHVAELIGPGFCRIALGSPDGRRLLPEDDA